MIRSSTNLKLGAALLVFYLCHLDLAETVTLSRHKRGFRQDAATRVAHGYGKRAQFFLSRDHLSRGPQHLLENFPSDIEDSRDGSTPPMDELEDLLISQPMLARFLLQKYFSPRGDDLVSSEQLFKHEIQK